MRTENDIRAALRMVADDAPDAGAVLSALPAVAQPDGSTRRGRSRGRLVRVLAPVAAATAVIAVVATSVAIGTGGRPAGAPGPREAAPSTEAHDGAIPPYYVLVWAPPGGKGIVATIKDTSTEAALTTVRPPEGYHFVDAAPGANIDTFLLEALQGGSFAPPRLYLLRFDPSDRRTSLTALPIPVTSNTNGLAMSPSGTEVAVANEGNTTSELQIYTLAGRLIRQWQGAGAICALSLGPCMSWATSGYLAFSLNNYGANPAVEGIWLIKATEPSGSLLVAGRLVVPFRKFLYQSFFLSGDGSTIVADIQTGSGKAAKLHNVFDEFSTATGKLTARYWQSHSIYVGNVFWANWTGSKLVVQAPFPRTMRGDAWPLGILTAAGFKPLMAASGGWFAIAF
jgi:hypothetical protein